MRLRVIVVVVCHFLNMSLSGQDRFQGGLLPAVNLNWKLDHGWSLNYELESRQELIGGTFGAKPIQKYDYILTDNTLVAAKKWGLNSRVALGYLFRIREGNVVHRSILQYAWTQSLEGFRLSHRWVCDQTFASGEDIAVRLRYRLATEIPLDGVSVDARELYLKGSLEALNIWVSEEYALEARGVMHMGYRISDRQRVELGMDYRLTSLVEADKRHSFWTSMSWFIVLP